MRPEPPLVFHPSSLADLPLDLVIDRIDAGLGDEDGFLITLRDVQRGLQLGFRPLEEHPVDVLLGWRAPREVDALGVAVTGTARTLDAGPGPDDLAGRVRIVQIHARDGRAASASGGWARTRRRSSTPARPTATWPTACGGRSACPRLPRRAVRWRGGRSTGSTRCWRRCAGSRRGAGRGRTCPACTRARARSRPTARRPSSSSSPGRAPGSTGPASGSTWAPRAAPGARSGPSWPPGWTTGCSPGGSSARWPDPVDVVVDLVDLLPPAVTRGVVEALQAWRCW